MSKLEERMIDSLETIGYDGPMLKKPAFPMAVEGGPKSVDFTELVHFLTNEIRTLLGIDEEVNAIASPEDSVAFVMEITSFLKELNCPYSTLMHGHVSDRLQNVSDRLLLLDYLVNEVMAARILQEKKPTKKIELKIQETSEGKDMRLILQTLRFPKPPPNISIQTLFQKLVPTIPIVLDKAGGDIVGKGIFNGFLSDKQWEILNGVNNDLGKEYKIRREMLLTRLDVTIQSFQWSDRTRGKDEMFEKVYYEKRKLLKVDPEVTISDLLAARTDLAIIEKTSNSSVRKNTKTSLNKVIIGSVPDRGGRTSEIAPPPPEMPSWQQRSSGPMGGGGRGGGRGGGNFQSRGGGNFQSRGGGGNFQSRGGGYQSNQNRGGGGGYDNKSFDSAGSYGVKDTGSYNRGGGYDNRGGRDNYDNRGSRDNYDSRGGGRNNYDSRGGGRDSYDNRGGRDSYDNRGGGRDGYESRGGGRDSYDNRGSGRDSYDSRRDSGGSYGSQDYQQNKRAKTYDSFQASKTTYADQYVQERQHNEQYSARGDSRSGSGRSNYQRGGRGGSYR